jgi:hypothetical protein
MIPRSVRFPLVGFLFLVAASTALAADWPQFRGPASLGIAAKDADHRSPSGQVRTSSGR